MVVVARSTNQYSLRNQYMKVPPGGVARVSAARLGAGPPNTKLITYSIDCLSLHVHHISRGPRDPDRLQARPWFQRSSSAHSNHLRLPTKFVRRAMAPDRSKLHQRVRLDLLCKHYEAEKNQRRSLFVAEAVDGDAQPGLTPDGVELSSPELVMA